MDFGRCRYSRSSAIEESKEEISSEVSTVKKGVIYEKEGRGEALVRTEGEEASSEGYGQGCYKQNNRKEK